MNAGQSVRIGTCSNISNVDTPVLMGPFSSTGLPPFRMPSRPTDRDMTTVGDTGCDYVHALGCTLVGERSESRLDSGDGSFAVRRDGIDRLARRKTMRDAHRKGKSDCLRGIRR